jgi:hypothetical protein
MSTEKTFSITFYGRENNAIGICIQFTKEVDAVDFEAARLKLYDTHEHIRVIEYHEVVQP